MRLSYIESFVLHHSALSKCGRREDNEVLSSLLESTESTESECLLLLASRRLSGRHTFLTNGSLLMT